jgi:hypothetical protein
MIEHPVPVLHSTTLPIGASSNFVFWLRQGESMAQGNTTMNSTTFKLVKKGVSTLVAGTARMAVPAADASPTESASKRDPTSAHDNVECSEGES